MKMMIFFKTLSYFRFKSRFLVSKYKETTQGHDRSKNGLKMSLRGMLRQIKNAGFQNRVRTHS